MCMVCYRIYTTGVNFNPLKLYSPVSYPVPSGTPMLAPLVKWDHSQDWDTPMGDRYASGAGGSGGASMMFEIDCSPDSKDHYLAGHKIDGRVLFPATGYLVLAWRALAKLEGQIYEQMPVGFENVHIHRATILPKEGKILQLTIGLHSPSRFFKKELILLNMFIH